VCVCVCVRARALCRLVLVLLHIVTCSTYNVVVAGGTQGEGAALYAVRSPLYTFLSPQPSRVKIYRSVYEYSPSRVGISIDLPTTVFLRPVKLYTNADCR
jgi:hypothetical protein